MLTDGDYHVYYMPLPDGIHGAVVMGEDDYYSIYINSNSPQEEQQKTFIHEIKHIRNNDFRNGLSIRDIEKE